MGDVIEFRKLTGIRCPHCGSRMAWVKEDNEIRCVQHGCGKGYLRSSSTMRVTVEDGRTIVEREDG